MKANSEYNNYHYCIITKQYHLNSKVTLFNSLMTLSKLSSLCSFIFFSYKIVVIARDVLKQFFITID